MEVSMKWAEGWTGSLAWLAGGLGVFALCLILTFPYGALQSRVMRELQYHSGLDIRSTQSAVRFPGIFEWRNVTLSKPEWGALQLAVLQTKVGLLRALIGELGLDVLIQADDSSTAAGVARGTVTGSSLALDGRVSVKGQFQQVDLSTLLRRYISRGTLNGEFFQHFESIPGQGSSMTGDGVWRVEVKDLTMDQIPLSNGLTLSVGFTRITTALSCRDAVCEVTEFKGEGQDGSFSGEGKLTVRQPVQNSQLALTVTIVPGAGFAGKGTALGMPPLPVGVPLTVKVLGTVAQPRISL